MKKSIHVWKEDSAKQNLLSIHALFTSSAAWFIERPQNPHQGPIAGIHLLAQLLRASNGGGGINSGHFCSRPEFDTTPLYRQPSFHLPTLPLSRLRPSTAVLSYQPGRSQGRHDGGVVDGCAAAAGALLLRAAVLAGAGPAGRRVLDAGGEQGVRGGAGGDRPGRAGQVGDGGDAAAQEDGRRRGGPLQGPRERRRLHRGWPRPLPSLRQLVPFLRRVHPGLGRRQRVQARVLPETRARRRAGAEEGHPLDGGGAQVVSEGSEEVRSRGLAEHLAELRDEPHADAGGEPRAEVLHPAHHGGQGQQAPLQHPRHHNRQRARRRRRPRQALVLGVAALRAHRLLGPARRATAACLRAAGDDAQPPIRQREAGAPGFVHGRRGPRPGRLAPPADAMRPAVKGVPCRARRKPRTGGEDKTTAPHHHRDPRACTTVRTRVAGNRGYGPAVRCAASRESLLAELLAACVKFSVARRRR